MIKENIDKLILNDTNEPNDITYEAMENDEDVYGPFDSIEELMEALES